MLWCYYSSVALHQVILGNHCHTQIRSSQRPQHTDVKRTQLNYIRVKVDVIHSTGESWIPRVFLDANFFRDGQREDDEEAHDEEGKSLVSVPVIRHLRLTGTRHSLIQRNTHWGGTNQSHNEHLISAATWRHQVYSRFTQLFTFCILLKRFRIF